MFKVSSCSVVLFVHLLPTETLFYVVWLLQLQVSTACKVAIEHYYVTAHACLRSSAVPTFWVQN